MGSYTGFKNMGDMTQQGGSNAGNSSCNNPLARQSSIYSLTFDEFQNTLGGSGKDFGSMNMEELLKSIWTAEESHGMPSGYSAAANGAGTAGNLQRQGSLTLPRTLSQKTVDEVWREVLKETVDGKDRNGNGNGNGCLNLGPREPTLGMMTLEDFLERAGVVKEEIQPSGTPTIDASFSTLPMNMGYQQPPQNHSVFGNQVDSVPFNSTNLGINMNGARYSKQPQLQSLFPKQATIAFSSSAQLSSPGAKGPVLGMPNASSKNMPESITIVRGGFSNGPVVMQGSPGNQLHLDSSAKGNVDTPSLSPSPYNFREGKRGPSSASTVQKVVERRQRRMIKNRESAARSRARKQAYTLELEAEVEKLKRINEDLRRKQEEFMELQRNQNQISGETMNNHNPWGGKRRCLRRTLTGPW